MTELHRSNKPTTGARTGRGAGAHKLSRLLRENLLALAGWMCLIVASLIAFRLTEGTQYHPLAAGIMMSSSSLFVLMTLFECLLAVVRR
jgi:hypothetical protein